MVPWRTTEGGVLLSVRLTPRAARNGIDGIGVDADGRPLLKIRLTAPPVDGEANAALVAFMAKTLLIKKADILIRAGQSGRTKCLFLSGYSRQLVLRLENLTAEGS